MTTRKKMKSAIGRAEGMKSVRVGYSENISDSASAAFKLMERITAMSLNRASGKLVKSVKTSCPTSTPHGFGTFANEESTMIKPNRSLSTKTFIIWVTTTMGDKNHIQMYSTQLYSHDNIVAVGKQECIIKSYGKSANIWPFSNNFQGWKRHPLLMMHCRMTSNEQ